ncbi:YNL200C [Zygosaccharomyces parabailii]|uniref:NAD(P)H-hydrate epimerase n=1 Tax=Zygosaccharomyces bailii (strain CLIB 213 / ATCC 58445 / CBS 680 / BCRC 21525 / NBRC 1098 / NCYC 1416 / NRRL Y-2227) TaxID=1333698 RepID=A0A8J2T8M4_ZYGB2|nr:YNL200C [Zygosaccharomyces parabailii]CDF89315.1 ZYBA0S04-01288g1_1 [Zygosaccharomyces bailii CLIB 213]CDH08270.1 related to NAD(P)H-hydrate epimerase [Zygosaccharomyces bailii ISA1307]SJM85684.1 probable NAD(P)H-hydrate epimerase [Zygosaccharomyces bailii]
MSLLKVVSSKLAAEIDQELMGPAVGFTLPQLMELAGFSVAQAVTREFPPGSVSMDKNVFVIAGPGNNGGDGLVCARHLKLFGYNPVVFYPKRSERNEFYKQLVNQLNFFKVPVLPNDQGSTDWLEYLDPERTLCIVDAIFGFSFKPPIREPFATILDHLYGLKDKVPIVSVDVPSGWDVDKGPITELALKPSTLVSLTVPKPCSTHLTEDTSHYVGGRFIPRDFANKYGFEPFDYEGTDQVLKL